MSAWFARLMQQGRVRSRSGVVTARPAGRGGALAPRDARERRDARYDAILRTLRERAAVDRATRERRQRGYRQSLETDPAGEGDGGAAWAPARLHRFRTKVPCRATAEARALIAELRARFPGSTVTVAFVGRGRQALMLAGGTVPEPTQIGRVEHQVDTDPARCNVRHHGLTVETDGDGMLALRFRYPRTGVSVTAARDPSVAGTDFTEIRTALDQRPADRPAAPRLVWLTRRELETIASLESRDYEAFYVRFKLEVLAGVWNALSAQLGASRASLWRGGAHYTVKRDPDATNGRIHQRTVDDGGRAVDVGAARVYDAAPATDILLLFLEEDLLAEFTDIYFTLRDVTSADAYFLKEEFFTVIRRFWESAGSLASRYGSDAPAVVRMAQRAVPMPTQVPLLKQDWVNLRQALVDRYGEGGRRASAVAPAHTPSTDHAGWPFVSFPAGAVNVGLSVTYRQEWRTLEPVRGEVVRTETVAAPPPDTATGGMIARSADSRSLEQLVEDALRATVDATRWSRELDGSVCIGCRDLAATTEAGLAAEWRESSRSVSARLADLAQRMTECRDAEPERMSSAAPCPGADAPPVAEAAIPAATDVTLVHRRLQHRYEILARPTAVRNVVLVAEPLPAPGDIDAAWIRRHAGVLDGVLLDESVRGALASVGSEPVRDPLLLAARERLVTHLRTHVLHYQRAIWRHEDPQQRAMRYRRSGHKLPLEWWFELDAGDALSIEAFTDRLTASDVDGQFAAYSGGREADVDQVIDPAGLVGHYGNYAVFSMRPECGSADLFSMLHFFKSPYLQPHPVTGEPVVDTGDLTRREDAREVTVDSGDVVIEVLRRDDPPEADDGPIGAPALFAAAEGFRLMDRIVEGARGAGLLSVVGHPDAPAAGGVRPRDDDAGRLHVGVRTAGSGSTTIAAPAAAGGRVALRAGSTDLRAAPTIMHAGLADVTPLMAGAGGPAAAESGVRLPVAGERIHPVRAGHAHETDTADAIAFPRTDHRGLRSGVGGGPAPAPHERIILAHDDEWLRPSLVTGVAEPHRT